MHLHNLLNSKLYFCRIDEDAGVLPWATGKTIKKHAKNKIFTKYALAKVPIGYMAVSINENNAIAVKYFYKQNLDKLIERAQQVKKRKNYKKLLK